MVGVTRPDLASTSRVDAERRLSIRPAENACQAPKHLPRSAALPHRVHETDARTRAQVPPEHAAEQSWRGHVIQYVRT